MTRSRLTITLGFIVTLAASAGVNIVQAQRIHALLDVGYPSSIVGRQAPPLIGFSLDGARKEIPLRGGLPTIVYFFRSTCGWCEQNWANMEAIHAAARGRYRLVVTSSERRLHDFIRDRHLTVDVLEGLDDGVRLALGFSAPPHTIAVSSDGQVTHEWRGAYTPRIERQIEDALDVFLPGLQIQPSAGALAQSKYPAE